MANPRLLLLDEVSSGWPRRRLAAVRGDPNIAAAGTTVLLVGQNIKQALAA
jgi:ABC-type branched-subunit amino acid transport system ATPase component